MDPQPPELVVDPDPTWPDTFEGIKSRIEPALAGVATSVEHIGSTAVPGLAAKPIIDIDVVVPDHDHVPRAIERLASLGYAHQGDLGVAGREAFRPPQEGPYHHLYVVVDGSEPHRNHMDLRDHLRRHPEDARRYADMKRDLASLLATDREAYTTGKSEIIEAMLTRARLSEA
ncbi:MAG: GrpB family protein [Actinomycetota bacterium]